MRKGEQTRQRIMDIAEAAILQKGFGATSIDEVIAEAEITKSGFIYHFHDKNQLALALLDRYLERDNVLLNDIEARAAALSDDPLQAVSDRAEAVLRKSWRIFRAVIPDASSQRSAIRNACSMQTSGR